MFLEEYALIGDCETAALVGRNGSIDWLCWPNFASAACFARLLGSDENGFWRLAPKEKVVRTSRRYEPDTLVLKTICETKSGTVEITDFMPPRETHSHIVRIVKGLHGKVKMHGELVLRFSYGEAVPWVTRTQTGLRAVAGPDAVELHTTAPLVGENLRTVSDFVIGEGESVSFVLTYGTYGSYREHSIGNPVDVQKAYGKTRDFWTQWAAQCTYQGKYRELVTRSMITLKALTFRPTGGVVAAPTTSLPEDIGGVRNWDYRYCWLRDTTFTLLALMNGGYYDEARDWMHWLHRTIAGKPDQLQIMYGISGERTLRNGSSNRCPDMRTPLRFASATRLPSSYSSTRMERCWMPSSGPTPTLAQDRQRSSISSAPWSNTSKQCGSSPTRAYGRCAEARNISHTPKSWPGLPSIEPSRLQRRADSRRHFDAGKTRATPFKNRCAPKASANVATALCSITDQNISTPLCC